MDSKGRINRVLIASTQPTDTNMKPNQNKADDLAIEASRLVIPKLKGVKISTLRMALSAAAEDVFKAEMLDTDIWKHREEGNTKEKWIHDRIAEWISIV